MSSLILSICSPLGYIIGWRKEDMMFLSIRSRRERSFDQLAWFARHVDECLVFNNSTGEPELVGGLQSGYLIQIKAFPCDFLVALNAAGLETPKLNNPDTWHVL